MSIYSEILEKFHKNSKYQLTDKEFNVIYGELDDPKQNYYYRLKIYKILKLTSLNQPLAKRFIDKLVAESYQDDITACVSTGYFGYLLSAHISTKEFEEIKSICITALTNCIYFHGDLVTSSLKTQTLNLLEKSLQSKSLILSKAALNDVLLLSTMPQTILLEKQNLLNFSNSVISLDNDNVTKEVFHHCKLIIIVLEASETFDFQETNFHQSSTEHKLFVKQTCYEIIKNLFTTQELTISQEEFVIDKLQNKLSDAEVSSIVLEAFAHIARVPKYEFTAQMFGALENSFIKHVSIKIKCACIKIFEQLMLKHEDLEVERKNEIFLFFASYLELLTDIQYFQLKLQMLDSLSIIASKNDIPKNIINSLLRVSKNHSEVDLLKQYYHLYKILLLQDLFDHDQVTQLMQVISYGIDGADSSCESLKVPSINFLKELITKHDVPGKNIVALMNQVKKYTHVVVARLSLDALSDILLSSLTSREYLTLMQIQDILRVLDDAIVDKNLQFYAIKLLYKISSKSPILPITLDKLLDLEKDWQETNDIELLGMQDLVLSIFISHAAKSFEIEQLVLGQKIISQDKIIKPDCLTIEKMGFVINKAIACQKIEYTKDNIILARSLEYVAQYAKLPQETVVILVQLFLAETISRESEIYINLVKTLYHSATTLNMYNLEVLQKIQTLKESLDQVLNSDLKQDLPISRLTLTGLDDEKKSSGTLNLFVAIYQKIAQEESQKLQQANRVEQFRMEEESKFYELMLNTTTLGLYHQLQQIQKSDDKDSYSLLLDKINQYHKSGQNISAENKLFLYSIGSVVLGKICAINASLKSIVSEKTINLNFDFQALNSGFEKYILQNVAESYHNEFCLETKTLVDNFNWSIKKTHITLMKSLETLDLHTDLIISQNDDKKYTRLDKIFTSKVLLSFLNIEMQFLDLIGAVSQFFNQYFLDNFGALKCALNNKFELKNETVLSGDLMARIEHAAQTYEDLLTKSLSSINDKIHTLDNSELCDSVSKMTQLVANFQQKIIHGSIAKFFSECKEVMNDEFGSHQRFKQSQKIFEIFLDKPQFHIMHTVHNITRFIADAAKELQVKQLQESALDLTHYAEIARMIYTNLNFNLYQAKYVKSVYQIAQMRKDDQVILPKAIEPMQTSLMDQSLKVSAYEQLSKMRACMKEWAFPFSLDCVMRVDGLDGQESALEQQGVKLLDSLRQKLQAGYMMLGRDHFSKDLIITGSFPSKSGYYPSFYTWKYQDHVSAISSLLNGEEITLSSHIHNSLTHGYAIRLKKIDIKIISQDEKINIALQQELHNFKLNFSHFPYSVFKFNDKIYQKYHDRIDFEKSFEMNGEEHLFSSTSYKELHSYHQPISPFSTYSMQMQRNNHVKSGFYKLNEIVKNGLESIQVELLGEAYYFDVNKSQGSGIDPTAEHQSMSEHYTQILGE
jgi:hypothetical protein